MTHRRHPDGGGRRLSPAAFFGLGLLSALVVVGLVAAALLTVFGGDGNEDPVTEPTTTSGASTSTIAAASTTMTTTTTTTMVIPTPGFSDVPPFHAFVAEVFPQDAYPDELTEDGLDIREVWHDPDGGFRLEVTQTTGPDAAADAAGSFLVWADGELSTYEAVTGIYTAKSEIQPPYLSKLAQTPEHTGETCGEAGMGTYLTRPVLRYKCDAGSSTWELWFDVDTGLMLREVWDFGYVLEVRQLDLDPQFPDGLFDFVPPPGAVTPEEWAMDPWNHTTLAAGVEAPTWEGPKVGGNETSLRHFRGDPTLILLWNPLDEELSLPSAAEFQLLFDMWRVDVNFVSVATREKPDQVRLIMSDNGLTFTTVDCFGGRCSPDEITSLWGVDTIPFWVLLNADGQAVAVALPTESTTADLQAALTAVAGR